MGSGEDIGDDDLVTQAGEFSVGEVNSIQCLEFLTEILLKHGFIVYVGPVAVFENLQLCYKALFDLVFRFSHCCEPKILAW